MIPSETSIACMQMRKGYTCCKNFNKKFAPLIKKKINRQSPNQNQYLNCLTEHARI